MKRGNEKKFIGDPANNQTLKDKIIKNPLLITSLVSIFSILIFREPILHSYGQWLNPSEEIENAEIAVVLDNDMSRLKFAAQLLKDNKVKALYASFLSKKDLDKIIQEYKLQKNQVFWGGCKRVPTTFDQAKYFREVLINENNTPYRNIALISSRDFHLRRALWTYQHTLKNTSPKFRIIPYVIREANTKDTYDWWNDDKLSKFIRSETQKYVFYNLYYGLLGKEKGYDVTFHDIFDVQDTGYNPNTYFDHCNGD